MIEPRRCPRNTTALAEPTSDAAEAAFDEHIQRASAAIRETWSEHELKRRAGYVEARVSMAACTPHLESQVIFR